ncbi:MAG: PEP/pyruvate-binding domain-containing protein, partial [Bacteroidota bacterium]
MKRSPKITGFLNRTRRRINFRKRKVQKASFALFFETFQKILTLNNDMLALIAGMGDKLSGDYIFDSQYIISACEESADLVHQLISGLNTLSGGKYQELMAAFHRINQEIREELAGRPVIPKGDYIIPYDRLNRDFEDVVGAKNANLAEINHALGLTIPDGFAVTTRAFSYFMIHNGLWDKVDGILNAFDYGEVSVDEASVQIQEMVRKATVPSSLKKALYKSIERLSRVSGIEKPYMAVRSSAWGEDTQASFAGQYETFLNQPVENLLNSYQRVIESAYSASAMEYRRQKGYSEKEVMMAVGCQLMVNAKVSGVLYTLDPMAPEKEVMLITALWGLGSP